MKTTTNSMTQTAALDQLRQTALTVRRTVRRDGPGSADHLGSELRALTARAKMAGVSEARIRRALYR